MKVYVIEYYQNDNHYDRCTANIVASNIHEAITLFKQNYKGTAIIHAEEKHE
jgi:hypothetical protein